MPRRPFFQILEEARGRGPLALIVEDHDELAAAFADALGTLPLETEIVSDGEQALARLADVTPVLVVLDLHVPAVSGGKPHPRTGKGILHELRNNPRFAETRIILSTGDALSAKSLEDQADLTLVKPFSPSQLHDLAERLAAL